MKKQIIYIIISLFALNSYCQSNNSITGFTDLDEALLHPNEVNWIHLSNQTKYSSSKELPGKLAECKNLHKIYLGWHKNLDLPKLFKLFSKLPLLDTLEMYACDLTELPKEIGLLTNLKFLKLDLNDIKVISNQIGNLKKITYLNLNTNHLEKLPSEIGELKSLKYLFLSNNELKEVPSSICNLNNLEELILWDNELTFLPKDLDKLENLKKLSISGNKFISLPVNIDKLKIEDFSLGGYKNSFSVFPYQIFKIKTLKSIGLFNIKIDKFPDYIKELNNLESIGLGNLIEFDWGDGLKKISELSLLRKVSINIQRYGDIPEEISLLNHISELKITGSTNSFQAMQYTSQLSNLNRLQFSNYLDSILPSEIQNLSQLEYLEFDKSKLYSLPPEIGKLENLQEFKASTNWGQSINIPKEIGQLKKLKKIDFGWSNIKKLPNEIGGLTSLKELNLWGSDLTNVPSSIGNLQNLETLYLSGNNLTKLPIELFTVKSLKTLDLSNNNLTEIDSNICNLSNLTSLDFSGNIDLKTTPICISDLTYLEDLNLSKTQISQIPLEYNTMAKLESIRLCKTLLQNIDEIDSTFKDKIRWEWSCRSLERLLVDFELKYGKITTDLTKSKDTSICEYKYFYNEPGVIDEEYWLTIKVKIIDINKVELNKRYSITDPNFIVSASSYSVWYATDYSNIEGSIKVLNKGKRTIELLMQLTGKFYAKDDENRELINKTLIFKK
jgi:Leucine-rich repeat (LRR) protein